MLKVELRRAPHSIITTALIDSGSPGTLFTMGLAHALALRLNNAGARIDTVHIGGRPRRAQFEQVELAIPGQPYSAWRGEVGFFLQEWDMPFAGVLGHAGFLQEWVVTLNSAQSWFELSRATTSGRDEGRSLLQVTNPR